MKEYFDNRMAELREEGLLTYDLIQRAFNAIEYAESIEMLGVFNGDQEKLDTFTITYFEMLVDRLRNCDE